MPLAVDRIRRFFSFSILLFCGQMAVDGRYAFQPAPLCAAAMQALAPSSFLKMRIQEGNVTAEMRVAPLQRVLEELAARTGIVFEISALENEPVTMRLYKVPLADAVRRLVHPNNAIIYYGARGEGKDRISLVRIFSRSARSQQPGLRYIGTGSITRTGEDAVESLEEALRILAESSSVEARQKAVEFLVALKGDTVPPALLRAVEDPAPEVRIAAIEGIAGMGIRSALPVVLNALKDRNPGVRQSAVSAVALLGDHGNIKDLRPLVREADRSVAAAAEIAIKILSVRNP